MAVTSTALTIRGPSAPAPVTRTMCSSRMRCPANRKVTGPKGWRCLTRPSAGHLRWPVASYQPKDYNKARPLLSQCLIDTEWLRGGRWGAEGHPAGERLAWNSEPASRTVSHALNIEGRPGGK